MAVSEEMARRLRDQGIDVTVSARELDKVGINSAGGEKN